MTTRWYSEEDLKVSFDVFEQFAKRNNFDIHKKYENGTFLYYLTRKCIPVHFISGADQVEFKFMDIADLHIGHPLFDENALRKKLSEAVKNGYTIVFIAGDLFEGACNKLDKMQFNDQIKLASSIFKDYPLTYYAINGNHDYSFEQIGLSNPIECLASKLQQEGIEFYYFDTYVMDFIICGVVKRVMHVERQDFNKKKIFASLKIKMFDEENMLMVHYNEEDYPVRFFQVGHIHVNVQMFYAKKKIYISQSGSFLMNEKVEDRANFIQGKVIDQKVFLS